MRDLSQLISPGFFGDNAAADTRRLEFDNKNSQVFVENTPISLCFIGDSITENWDLHLYFRKYGFLVNRGIGGDIAEHMTKRFDADVLQLNPRLCIAMVGINNTWRLDDLAPKGETALLEEAERIFSSLRQSYQLLLKKAQKSGQPLLMCSLLPVGCRTYRKQFVLRVNQMLQELCREYRVPYIDYHTALAAEDGMTLQKELSWDGLHPHALGYRRMAEVLYPYLDQFFAE